MLSDDAIIKLADSQCMIDAPMTEAVAVAFARAIEAAAMEEAAKICERRAEQRWEGHGYVEPDTNAGYYVGDEAGANEVRDEEDADCAAAIRAKEPPC